MQSGKQNYWRICSETCNTYFLAGFEMHCCLGDLLFSRWCVCRPLPFLWTWRRIVWASILKIEAARSSEISVPVYITTWHQIQRDSKLVGSTSTLFLFTESILTWTWHRYGKQIICRARKHENLYGRFWKSSVASKLVLNLKLWNENRLN
jgi:hypothetical protein